MFEVLITVYIFVGTFLAFYWLHKEYKEFYNESHEGTNFEEATIGILFVLFSFGWPIKLVRSWLKKLVG